MMRVMSIAEAERGLIIDKADLDEENIRNPQMYYDVSSALVEASYQRDQQKATVEGLYAELDRQQRAKVLPSGKSPSETAIKIMIGEAPKMRAAEALLLKLTHDVSLWQAMKESYQQRSYSLKNLGELYSANYFMRESSGSATVDHKEQLAERNRQASGRVRRARRQAND